MGLSIRPADLPRATAMRAAVIVAAILLATGCAKDEPASSTSDQPGPPKTEMVFLAQYEPLRTRARAFTQGCDDSQPRCQVEKPRPISSDEQEKFNACMERAINQAQEEAGHPPATGEESGEWLARHSAAIERHMNGCLALLPHGTTLGYGRGYGYTGRVGDAIASAQDMANATSPVDVVITTQDTATATSTPVDVVIK